VSNVGDTLKLLLQRLGSQGGLTAIGLNLVLSRLESSTGLNIERDVLGWMGSGGLFVRSAGGHTGGGLIVESTDPGCNDLNDLWRDLEFPPDEWDTLLTDYRRIYPERKHASTRVYPGVREGLASIEGRKSTATTKGTPTTRMILELFELAPYFDHVQGTDGFPAKPEPDVIFTALTALGAKPEECLFVGDSATDMEAGRRAGVRTCAVTYGYGLRSEMEQWSPDYWIDDLRELGRNGSSQ